MADLNLPLHGDEWQNWANQLLTEHYGPTDYVKIPDTEGDGGIEGFTRKDGHVYQAYGAEPGKTATKLYEAQRNKMTDDIGKFIKNKKLLTKIFGQTKIKCWSLIVPVTSLKEIIPHANKKTAEVVAANLPYVDSGFYVTICDEDHFAKERDMLLSYKASGICLDSETPLKEEIQAWSETNPKLVETLDEKLGRLKTVPTMEKRSQFRHDILIWHLEGKNLLESLRQHSPIVHERVWKTKNQFERNLSALQMATSDSAKIFQTTLHQFKTTLSEVVTSISSLNTMSLAHEAVADWLLRCPLDFPAGDENG